MLRHRSIFNSTQRLIHLHKESAITYNLSAKRTSDLFSTFYCCCLRSTGALWTWQIGYWRTAAAAAFSVQPVLSFVSLQLSPLPPPAQLSTSQLPWAGPSCLSATLLIPPCPSLSSKVWKGSQTNAICSGRKWQVRPALGYVTRHWPWNARPTKNKVKRRFGEKQTHQLSTVTNQESGNWWKPR